jgi:PAT family beta-lactamase induction signal transducer AmpG
MNRPGTAAPRDWRGRLPDGVRPYFESAPLAAACLGISSGFAFAMIGATLTTRLAQYGIRKSTVTAFALTFLAYNFKWLWAPFVDTIRIPILGRFGSGDLALADWPVRHGGGHLSRRHRSGDLAATIAAAAVLIEIAGATRHRHRRVDRAARPPQLGVGSGMS